MDELSLDEVALAHRAAQTAREISALGVRLSLHDVLIVWSGCPRLVGKRVAVRRQRWAR